MQDQRSKGTADEQRPADDGDGYEAFAVLWRVSLLPYDEGQPSLYDVGHLVHAADDYGSLLVIVGADLVSPSTICEFGVTYGRQEEGHLRHA